MSIIIVTRHLGAIEWLRRQGIEGTTLTHITEAAANVLDGADVYGALPFHLAARCNSVTVIDMPNLRPDQRGQDLTPEEMDEAGARLERYVVRTARQVAIEKMYND